MNHQRVLPRDLFNEANLLKCIGHLWLKLEGMANIEWDYNGEPFEMCQDQDDDSVLIDNLILKIKGTKYFLTHPLNSREAWPLYAWSFDTEEETAVFNEYGALTAEFFHLIGEKQ